MRICDLRNKQVINASDCRLLGCVIDIDFNETTGCICSVIIPGPGRLCGLFGHDTEYVIPFRCIRCIGPDAILVEVCLENVTQKCV